MTWFDPRRPEAVIQAVMERKHNASEDELKEALEQEFGRDAERVLDVVRTIGGREVLDQGGRFDPLSLNVWVEAANKAGVPAVDAVQVGRVGVVEAFAGKAPALDLSPGDGGMVRVDYAASAKLKIAQALRGDGSSGGLGIAGATVSGDDVYLDVDDRVCKQALSYVGEAPMSEAKVPVLWRPWIQASEVPAKKQGFLDRMLGRGAVGSWPMEWRVFVHGGEIQGASAYYIQAPVEDEDWVLASAEEAIEKAGRLAEMFNDRGVQPWHPRYQWILAEDEQSFTLDFVVDRDGRALFLEGGPACLDSHEPAWGAHPCFFAGRDIEGLALSKNDIRPLPGASPAPTPS